MVDHVAGRFATAAAEGRQSVENLPHVFNFFSNLTIS